MYWPRHAMTRATVAGATPNSAASSLWVLRDARRDFNARICWCHAKMRATCSSVRRRGRPIVLFMTEFLRDAGELPARPMAHVAAEQSRPRKARARARHGRRPGRRERRGRLKAPQAVPCLLHSSARIGDCLGSQPDTANTAVRAAFTNGREQGCRPCENSGCRVTDTRIEAAMRRRSL